MGLAVELVVPLLVEQRIEEDVREQTRGAIGIDADLESFPFITRLLLTGRVARLEVGLAQVVRRRLTFSTLAFDIEDIQLDRSALSRRDLEVRGIGRATVTATLDEEALSEAGAYVDLGAADVAPQVRGRALVVGTGAAARSLPLPTDLFPCEPAARLQEEAIVLSCVVDEVPSLLLRWLEPLAGR